MSRIEDGGAVEAGLVERLRAMAPTVGGTLSFEGRSTRAMNDDIRRAAAEIARLRAENAGMLEALDGIANTLSALRMQAEKDAGGRDGRMGAFLSNDIAHLIRIAALSKASQAEGGKK